MFTNFAGEWVLCMVQCFDMRFLGLLAMRLVAFLCGIM